MAAEKCKFCKKKWRSCWCWWWWWWEFWRSCRTRAVSYAGMERHTFITGQSKPPCKPSYEQTNAKEKQKHQWKANKQAGWAGKLLVQVAATHSKLNWILNCECQQRIVWRRYSAGPDRILPPRDLGLGPSPAHLHTCSLLPLHTCILAKLVYF